MSLWKEADANTPDLSLYWLGITNYTSTYLQEFFFIYPLLFLKILLLFTMYFSCFNLSKQENEELPCWLAILPLTKMIKDWSLFLLPHFLHLWLLSLSLGVPSLMGLPLAGLPKKKRENCINLVTYFPPIGRGFDAWILHWEDQIQILVGWDAYLLLNERDWLGPRLEKPIGHRPNYIFSSQTSHGYLGDLAPRHIINSLKTLLRWVQTWEVVMTFDEIAWNFYIGTWKGT